MESLSCSLSFFYEYLLSQNTPKDHIIRIELDQRKYYKFRNPITLCEHVEEAIRDHGSEQFFLLVDEVQFTSSVVDEANGGITVTIYDMLNELKSYKNLDVYVTGSNSRMLSKDIATEFRGRATQIHVYPLSFEEYYSYVGGEKKAVLPRLHAFAHTGVGEGGSIPPKAVVHPRCVRLSAAHRQAP